MAAVDPPPPPPPPPAMMETVMHLEPRPFRRYKSSEEYLWAMKEDLAEWLNALYDLDITAENFFERLETGVTLCQHANHVRRLALERHQSGLNGFQVPIPNKEVTYRSKVTAETFLARDNVSNFISWCRSLGIYECLLFETDDLVLRKNERSFILCLLEVARRGSKFGMPAPLLVQMEEEIDREIAKDNERKMKAMEGEEESEEEDQEPPQQIITNDLKSLDEMVRDLVNRCTCPVQFPMIRVSEGKYRIGDTQMLIFVRILRSHVMVRVGGGWDTLEHYLDKHDPCRCKAGHRGTVGSKVTIRNCNPVNTAQTQMQVTYERSPEHFRGSANSPKTVATTTIPNPPGSPQRVRRTSLTSKSSTGSLASNDNNSSDKERNLSNEKIHHPRSSSPNSSSLLRPEGKGNNSAVEQVDEGYQSGSRGPVSKNRRYSGHKLPDTYEEINGQHADNQPDNKTGGSPKPTSRRSSLSSNKVGNSRAPYPLDEAWQAIDTLSQQQQKALSTENLAVITNNKLHPTSYNVTNNKARRYSGDSGSSTNHSPSGKPPSVMTRSRSQCSEDSDMVSYLQRRVPGRNSYRTPGSRIPRMSTTTTNNNHTWSCKQKDSRPSLSSDLFTPPSQKQPPSSKSPSPQRRNSNGVTNGNNHYTRSPPPPSRSRASTPPLRQHANNSNNPSSSPNKALSPILQEVLAAANSDEQLLRKMEEIVHKYKGRIEDGRAEREELLLLPPQPPTDEIPGENYTKYWVAANSAPANNGTNCENGTARNRHSSGTSHSLGSPEDSGSDIQIMSRENSHLGSHQLGHSTPDSISPIPKVVNPGPSGGLAVRISPRKDSLPGSTRIPMPTFYSS